MTELATNVFDSNRDNNVTFRDESSIAIDDQLALEIIWHRGGRT